MKKKILLIGGGGREHALAWKFMQSPLLEKLYRDSGADIAGCIALAKKEQVDFTFVGPDAPLAVGIVDEFQKAGLRIFGPTKAAAELEWSKAYAKDFMARHHIPTAEFKVFNALEHAQEHIRKVGAPIVIKASGLALGKGVFVCKTLPEAEHALTEIFVNKIFGDAGNEVVIEEFLSGPEISIHAISDGKTYQIFPVAQDHKTIFENGNGPNTGGMGTIAPVPWLSEDELEIIEDTIIRPTLEGLKKDGRPFTGILFPGLMMTPTGPKVIEFNARFGDPEAESYMRILKTDLVEIAQACIDKKLDKLKIEWEAGAACTIILASGGYPDAYERGKEITGIAEAEKIPNVLVFHCGTAEKDGKLVTNGGRVLAVSARGATLKEALDTAYQAVSKIHFDGMQYRTDIGKDTLSRL